MSSRNGAKNAWPTRFQMFTRTRMWFPLFWTRRRRCAPRTCAIPKALPPRLPPNPSWTNSPRRPEPIPSNFASSTLDDAAPESRAHRSRRKSWLGSPAFSQRSTHAASEIATGRGVAVALRGGTRVATVAEVEVNRRTGARSREALRLRPRLRVDHQPRGARRDCRGEPDSIAEPRLKEEVTFDGNPRDQRGLEQLSRRPGVGHSRAGRHHLINHPEIPPSGAGEPPAAPTAAAIGNAIFDATGARLRRVPLTPEGIRAAVAALRPA